MILRLLFLCFMATGALAENDAATDSNPLCYSTGNGGGQAGQDDVDGGTVRLTSPAMRLAGLFDAKLTFQYWFFNAGGNTTPNDTFTVRALNNTQSVVVFRQTASEGAWRSSPEISLKNFIALDNNVRIEFSTADAAPGHIVEAAMDVFRVVPQPTSGVKDDIDASASVVVTPNPSRDAFALTYAWPGRQRISATVYNALGQLMHSETLNAESGVLTLGEAWPSGVYLLTLRDGLRQSKVLRLVKE